MRPCLLALVALLSAPAYVASSRAQDVTADVVVTRLDADRWRVDYAFDTAVSAVVFGRPVASYRERAWRPLTPGVEIVEEGGRESAVSQGPPLDSLSVEVHRYTGYPPDDYAPVVPFSDGGAALYLGHLTGEAVVDGEARPVEYRFRFVGLPTEGVVAPSGPGSEAYAYFGPQEPVALGHARLLVDPATPVWLGDAFAEVAGAVTPVFEGRLGTGPAAAAPAERPLVVVGAAELEAHDGYSVKGGAVGGQVVFLLSGRGLVEETGPVRSMFERLAAHELAHLWQLEAVPGGFNGEEPWVHEGAAEAMAVHALVEGGVWDAAEAEAYAGGAAERCRTSLGGADASGDTLAAAVGRGDWDAVYACGLSLYRSSDPFAVWRALAEGAHREGRPYTHRDLEKALSATSD